MWSESWSYQCGRLAEEELTSNPGELTFAVVVETKDDREPASNAEMNGVSDDSCTGRRMIGTSSTLIGNTTRTRMLSVQTTKVLWN